MSSKCTDGQNGIVSCPCDHRGLSEDSLRCSPHTEGLPVEEAGHLSNQEQGSKHIDKLGIPLRLAAPCTPIPKAHASPHASLGADLPSWLPMPIPKTPSTTSCVHLPNTPRPSATAHTRPFSSW